MDIMFEDSNISTISNSPLAVLAPIKEPRRYTLAEYLRFEERSQELHEYYDGIITKLQMARGPHNEIIMNVGTALNIDIRANNKTYSVFGGQQAVYLPALNLSVYPDVLVIVETPKYWDNNQVLLINPIVVIEVLSKGTKKYDRTSKFTEYKTLESFQEYVLIDQNQSYIETYFKEEPNKWQGTDYKEMSDIIHFKSIDCSISFTDIYRNIAFKKK
jgi:Uma2 family endonuclease